MGQYCAQCHKKLFAKLKLVKRAHVYTNNRRVQSFVIGVVMLYQLKIYVQINYMIDTHQQLYN